MSEATCETCPWCYLLDFASMGMDAECRKNAPVPESDSDGAERYAIWPLIAAGRDWCGEHPDRKARFSPKAAG